MKMNQVFTRALSLLLCLCMVLSMGVTAFAAQGTATKAAGSAFESTKTLTNGGDSDPETYTIDIDALVNGEASEQHEGTPLDVAIVFDRSDSMSQPANVENVRTITSQTDLANYLDGRSLKCVTERVNGIEEVIGHKGAIIKKEDELLVYASQEVLLRTKIMDLSAWELLSLEGVVITAHDMEHGGEERSIIAYYSYWRELED